MVQFLLRRGPAKLLPACLLIGAIVLTFTTTALARNKSKVPTEFSAPQLLLEGGRKLTFEHSISDERDVRVKRGFWKKMLDVVAGEPDFRRMVRPYGVVTDSRGRIIVSDPGARGFHVFDFAAQKYKFVSHEGKEAMQEPQCIAVDRQDNIYVTDSEAGKVFVFDADGKFRRVIGSLKRGEGLFKRPTGIAVDSAAGTIYVTDTLRDKIFVLDMQGSVVKTIGKSGSAEAEFNFPTELRFEADQLIVVDAMNFRVQVLNRDGSFRYAVGHLGESRGDFFRPKGVGVDSEGHIYVVDAWNAVVQVFDERANLLYYFGRKGTGFGDFQLPSGLFIDGNNRVFVADSYNGRVQVFHYYGISKPTAGGER
jgi:DNA-binding beta-propeller fold protein YncE